MVHFRILDHNPIRESGFRVKTKWHPTGNQPLDVVFNLPHSYPEYKNTIRTAWQKMKKRKIIIDCDPGQDDAVMLLLALACPDEFDILGITTVAGNVPLDLTQRNARIDRKSTRLNSSH